MRLTDDQIAAIKAWLEVASGQRSNVVQMARIDIEAFIADPEEAREHRRILREALEIEQEAANHFSSCPECEGEGIPCEIGAEMAANAAEVRWQALAATEGTDGPPRT